MCWHFFRDIHVQYEDIHGGATLACVGSFFNTTDPISNIGLFFGGWMHAIRAILKSKSYSCLLLEGTSHNKWLVGLSTQRFGLIGDPFESSYYIINMVCPKTPIIPEQCLML